MKNDLVIKDNRLLQAKFTLTKTQSKFMAYMVNNIKKDDIDFFTYSRKIKDVLEILEIKIENIDWLRLVLEELLTKLVRIENNDLVDEATTLLSYFKIKKEMGIIEYRFDKSMKPFLLDLKDNFTKLSLEKILSFDSIHSIKMYELLQYRIGLLKKYRNQENLGTFIVDIQELKEQLVGNYKKGIIIIPKSYERFSNFKQKVLDVAYKELKDKGEYYFEYYSLKTNRKITSVKFEIHKNHRLRNPQPGIKKLHSLDDLKNQLKKLGKFYFKNNSKIIYRIKNNLVYKDESIMRTEEALSLLHEILKNINLVSPVSQNNETKSISISSQKEIDSIINYFLMKQKNINGNYQSNLTLEENRVNIQDILETGYSYDNIKAAIDWLFSIKGDWYRPNIYDTNKLSDKFKQIIGYTKSFRDSRTKLPAGISIFDLYENK